MAVAVDDVWHPRAHLTGLAFGVIEIRERADLNMVVTGCDRLLSRAAVGRTRTIETPAVLHARQTGAKMARVVCWERRGLKLRCLCIQR